MAVDEALVALFESVDFELIAVVGETLYDTAHRRVQSLAVAAAGEHTDT